jgi:GDP-4-dehydro-6-deoxy-D-mannose reductase
MTGFAGSHLADFLVQEPGLQVYGVGLPSDSTRNLDHLLGREDGRVSLQRIDLNDYAATLALLDAVQPNLIFHLAAQASIGRSWSHPAETLVNNMTAQVNILQAVVESGLGPRILVVGSADEYGLVAAEDLPIDEETPLRPLNPYAVSKVAQDYLGLQYHLSHDLPIVRVRPFNHVGPRQGPGFVVPDFCLQIAEVEAGRRAPILRVGNLAARRDFTDVRDMVRGYFLALTRGVPGQVYNIGSGQACAIEAILAQLVALSSASLRIETDPERLRPSDVPELVCDARRFREATGWQPSYTLTQTLSDALNDWRARVAMA